jgi:hypothetical protein
MSSFAAFPAVYIYLLGSFVDLVDDDVHNMNSYLLLILVGCCCSCDAAMAYISRGRTSCHRVDGGLVMHCHAWNHVVCPDILLCIMVFAAGRVLMHDNHSRNMCLTYVVEMFHVGPSAIQISLATLMFDGVDIDDRTRTSPFAQK